MNNQNQLRITTVVSSQQKKQASRMARDLSAGNVGELVRQLLKDRFELYLKQRKNGSTPASAKLVRGKPVRASKPARKRSTGNATTNGTKRRTAKRTAKSGPVAVPRKKAGRRASRTAK